MTNKKRKQKCCLKPEYPNYFDGICSYDFYCGDRAKVQKLVARYKRRLIEDAKLKKLRNI